MNLMFLCRRASKNPACLEKRAKMSDGLNRDSEEGSPSGTVLRTPFLLLMFLHSCPVILN